MTSSREVHWEGHVPVSGQLAHFQAFTKSPCRDIAEIIVMPAYPSKIMTQGTLWYAKSGKRIEMRFHTLTSIQLSSRATQDEILSAYRDMAKVMSVAHDLL